LLSAGDLDQIVVRQRARLRQDRAVDRGVAMPRQRADDIDRRFGGGGQPVAQLDQRVQAFKRQLGDFVGIEVLNQQGQFSFLRRLVN